MNGSSTIDDDDNDPFQLSQTVCEAMERGEYSKLPLLLNISRDDGIAHGAAHESSNTSSGFPSSKCRHLLQVFYFSIGRTSSLIDSTATSESVLPMAIKSHLMLQALLHPNILPSNSQTCNIQHSHPWEAAVAAIQSIQYSHRQTNSNNNSVSENMAMVAEIRQFVTNLRRGKFNHTKNIINEGEEDVISGSIENVINTLDCLLDLGSIIIAPLLLQPNKIVMSNRIVMKRMYCKEMIHDNTDYTRREQSYLLPLELLPGILATLDSLDDMLAELIVVHQQRQQLEWGHREVATEMDVDVNDNCVNDVSNEDIVERNDDDNVQPQIRYSDRLLAAIFNPFTSTENDVTGVDKAVDKVLRSIRADAALPLLALAIDDIGIDRMAMNIPRMCNVSLDHDMTYWDCCILSLCHVIQSNLLCYKSNEEGVLNNDQNQVISEAINDDGTHIITPSDYPAMVRCVFRMIATNSSHNNNSNNNLRCSLVRWESLLLQFYHAAAVASAKLPSINPLRRRRNGSVTEHHSATLSTVESHVLLPSFTGASVLTIRSILDSCISKRPSVNATWWKGMNDVATPNWAVAGIILLIMRARSSNLSNLMGVSSSCTFGPRAVFRIASDVMQKKVSNTKRLAKENKQIGLGSDDEIGQALTVLLAIRGGEVVNVSRYTGDADKCALALLGDIYYESGGTFRYKYLSGHKNEIPYESQLGFKTIAQYANLVCSSLYRGNDRSERTKPLESSILETARTWIDAAFMLLDEMSNVKSKEKASSCKASSDSPDGDAMALTIIAVVFCEVPSARQDIVQSVYDRIVSSSSRTNDSSKRITSEKCFVLVSLLAWSLVATYDRNPPPDTVRRKSDKFEEASATLRPLCTLLTTPAPVYDVFLDTEKPSLTYWGLQLLSRSLIPISSGRESVLSMAKKHLRFTSTTSSYSYTAEYVTQFSESIPSNPSTMRDALTFAVCSLCTLLEKYDPSHESSTLDEYGLEALVIISDIIASSTSAFFVGNTNSSGVPRVILCRMISEITTAVHKSRLHEWVTRRLLNSCFRALIIFFQSDDDSSSPNLMSRRLFRSTNNGASFQTIADVEAILLLVMEISNFLEEDTIDLLLKRQILNVVLGKASQAVSNDINGSEGDNKANTDIGRACTNFILQGVSNFIQVDNFSQTNNDDTYTQQLIEDIVIADRLAYDNLNRKKNCSPNWLSDEEFQQINHRNHELPDHFVQDLKSSGEYRHFYGSMCGIVMSSLLSRHHELDEASDISIDVLRCLHHVIGKRRKVCSLGDSSIIFDEKSRSILDLSSQHLRRLLLSNSELSEIDLVVRNVVDLCHLCIEAKCGRQCSITSTWNFYSSLDDSSSQALIACLKKYYVDEYGWKKVKVNQNDFSLLHIDSPESIDENVRYFRAIILENTSNDLKHIETSCDVFSLEDRSDNLSVYLKLLIKLCEDWRLGFDGLSGGMDKLIFNLFLETTAKCADAIASSMDHLPPSILLGMKDKFVSVAESITVIWNIFKEERLLGLANRIKGTVRLCIDTLPQLLRKMEGLLGEIVLNETVSNHSVTLLEQCLLQIKADTSQDDAKETKISVATENNTEHDENNSVEREFEIEEGKKPVTMLNISCESVEWVYTGVFVAFQQLWGNSYKLMARGKFNSDTLSTRGEKGTLLLRKRRQELSLTLAAMYKVFDHIDSSAKMPVIFAELLSYQSKSALCKCLELVTVTLISSVKHLNQYFQNDQNQRIQYREMKHFDEAKLGESIVCVLGCLCSIRLNEAKHDIITGPIQWYWKERENLDFMYKRGEDYSMFSRLPKMIYRLEVLEAELRKLVRTLIDPKMPAWKEKMLPIDQMASTLNNDDEESTNLFDLIQEYLGALNSRKKEMNIDVIDVSALGGGVREEVAESDLEEDAVRKRPMQQFRSRRKRRMSLRSRNDTIDNWLTLDDENFASTPGERYNDVDAYVDLEDFIVEG